MLVKIIIARKLKANKDECVNQSTSPKRPDPLEIEISTLNYMMRKQTEGIL